MQLKYTLFSSISMLAFSSLSVFSQTEKMNVLFRFAASGLLFQNAYCNIPVSGASRASLLTGVYPHYPDRFVNYSAYASKDCPTAIPISRWFTSHGYYTISNGKVFHHLSDHANSWSEPPYRKHPDGYDVYWAEYNKWELWMNEASARTINPKTMRGPFCEWALWHVDFGSHIYLLMPLKNIGIYMTERKFQLLTIVFVLKIYRMRLKTLQKSTLTHVPPQQMIFLFRKKPNMDSILV